jgi:hypothetical protein
MSLFNAIARGLLHAEKPRAEHVRDRIFEANGTYFFVPKGNDFGYRLNPGEAATIAERADATMANAQKQAGGAVIVSVFFLVFLTSMLSKLGLPPIGLKAAWSKASPIIMLAIPVCVAILVHHLCLVRFDRTLEAELSRHTRVPMNLLRDPKAATSLPKIIRYCATLIILPLFGWNFYAVTRPLNESNRLMAKSASLLHYIHIPLMLAGVALAVHFYYLRKKRGF